MQTLKSGHQLKIKPRNGATFDLTFSGIVQPAIRTQTTVGPFTVDREYAITKNGTVEISISDPLGVESFDADSMPPASDYPAGHEIMVNGAMVKSDGARWSRSLDYSPNWNNIIGALGDSRMNNAGKNGTSENIGPLHWACMMSGQRLSFQTRYNFGVGGYTTQDIIDNTLSPACLSETSSFFVLAGTNDRATMTRAQTISNIETIVDRLIASGKDVYLMAEFPRGDAAFTPTYRLSSQQLLDHLAVRDHILSMRGRNNLFICDAWNDLAVRASATGDIKTGLSIDGLHQNTRGAYYASKSIAAQIIARHPVAPSVAPSSNVAGGVWLNANPMLDGSTAGSLGTGGSGSIGTSWQGSTGSTVGGITRVYSKTAEGYQQVVIGGTAASGSNPQMDILRQTGLQTSITPGSEVYAVGEIDVAANASNIIAVQIGVMVTKADASVEYVWDGELYTSASPIPTEAFSGVWKTEPITVPAGATDVRLMARVYGVSSAACSGTVIVRSLGLRYV